MAKFNRQPQFRALSHEEEYAIVRKDLRRVLALNALYLAAILALYFSNQHSHFLDAWFSKVLHF